MLQRADFSNDGTFFHRRHSRIIMNTDISKQTVPDALPKSLYILLNILGLQLCNDKGPHTNKNLFQNIFICSNLKVIMSHLIILLVLSSHSYLYIHHITFVICVVLDYSVYVIGVDLLLYRKKKLSSCIKNLLKIHQCNKAISCMEVFRKNHKCASRTSKHKMINILIWLSVIYGCSYCLYGIFYVSQLTNIGSLKTKNEVIAAIVYLMHRITYCIFVYIGIPVHTVLFVYVCSLVYDGITNVRKSFNDGFIENITANIICAQRTIFCKLIRYSSSADSIFNEIVAVWLLKIIIRICLCAVDVLTRTWIGPGSETQVIVLLDIIFDVVHLIIMFSFGGRIHIEKMKALECLTCMCEKIDSQNKDIRIELQFFMTLLAHCDIGFTVANTFALDRKTSVTILGALVSYSVLIYQLASK